MRPPVVSAVLTVFDKADVLDPVLDRLQAEAGPLLGEVVAVEDGSADSSADLLLTRAARWPALRVLRDGHNRGPSIRLNEGVAAARGEWLLLIDADGVLRSGALAVLYRLATAHGLDALHARVERVDDLAAGESLGPFPADPGLALPQRPLAAVLTRRGLVRMAWLVRRDCFLRAGGVDPAIFVQDESLTLRLAGAAERIGLCAAAAVFEPKARFNLSGDRRQQHHDRFMAHYHYLCARPDLAAELQRLLIDRCLASARRAVASGLLPGRSALAIRLRRLALALGWPLDARAHLAELARLLQTRPGIRRPGIAS